MTDFETIVDIEAWDHHEESIRVYAADKGGDDEAVPALVRFVEDTVDGVC